jgi:hypothetical protein
MNKYRFYDQDTNVSQAVELLLVLPQDMQSIIADGISLIAEQEFRANELMNELKSLGTEKVLAVYKSKQKKRAYDKNQAVHRAINYLMVLSENNRLWISKRIVGLMAYLQDYLKTCRLYSVQPTQQSVDQLTTVYVKFGPDEVKSYLKAVEAEFISQGRQKATTQGHMVEVIMDEGIGLRIRSDQS